MRISVDAMQARSNLGDRFGHHVEPDEVSKGHLAERVAAKREADILRHVTRRSKSQPVAEPHDQQRCLRVELALGPACRASKMREPGNDISASLDHNRSSTARPYRPSGTTKTRSKRVATISSTCRVGEEHLDGPSPTDSASTRSTIVCSATVETDERSSRVAQCRVLLQFVAQHRLGERLLSRSIQRRSSASARGWSRRRPAPPEPRSSASRPSPTSTVIGRSSALLSPIVDGPSRQLRRASATIVDEISRARATATSGDAPGSRRGSRGSGDEIVDLLSPPPASTPRTIVSSSMECAARPSDQQCDAIAVLPEHLVRAIGSCTKSSGRPPQRRRMSTLHRRTRWSGSPSLNRPTSTNHTRASVARRRQPPPRSARPIGACSPKSPVPG